ncbi:hypothetical protein E2C01_100235 [Portunus trituberculatus]|uniref:Uncharacterized protein n=1 Tax=Portunus trituberculatus TaxID=210409 RepID=A0A5B7K691_PORTR|nr:hypothetical protein [Portunus trituberculatus]
MLFFYAVYPPLLSLLVYGRPQYHPSPSAVVTPMGGGWRRRRDGENRAGSLMCLAQSTLIRIPSTSSLTIATSDLYNLHWRLIEMMRVNVTMVMM